MDYRVLVDMAVLAGEIMLVSGAEVYRIEDTVSRILKYSKLEGIEVFVLPTGIFATLSDPSIGAITVVKRVKRRASNLNRVYCVNDVSRRFCNGEMELCDASEELKRIVQNRQYSEPVKGIGYVLTSACFALLFGGNGLDCLASALVGGILALTVFGASRLPLNDFCLNAAAAFFVTIAAVFFQKTMFHTMNIDAVIISSIMPLVPGVTFTSGIRDTLNGDYSSGSVRITEAIVVALAVASGVGMGMLVFPITGGGL